MPKRPLIGLVTVRYTLFDAEMGADFPARMRAHRARSIELLEPHFEVVAPPLIENEADAVVAESLLAAAKPSAVVFAPTMAAPPSYAARALGGSDTPVVIWNAPSILSLPDDLSQAQATVNSTTIGSLMYANVRVRDGRPVAVVTAAHADPAAVERLVRTVRGVAAAGALNGSTFLRVGDPMAGYLDIEASTSQLALLGVVERAVSVDQWELAVDSVPASEAADLLEQLRVLGWTGDPGPASETSARIAVALGRALDDAGAVGGTVNCHGPWFRRSPRVGLPACLGVACQTAGGRPISCTGDQPTAIALSLARLLAGAALYCECYTPEIDSGLVLLAAGGEGDPAWAAEVGAVTLEANDHYPGERGQGTSVAFALRPGPATILSLSPTADGWVLVWGTGELVESRYPNMRGPNGMFRFDRGPADRALEAWIEAGATHHSALAPGRLDVEIPALAGALRIRSVQV
jgi:L-arabinose isomerase